MSEASENVVQLGLERIYLKDASFESPNSPLAFAEERRPQIQVDINTRVSALDAQRFEVVLILTVTARKSESQTLFLVEVHQAGIFAITGADENQLRLVLGIACPSTLFPYAREAVDGLVVKGGFGPVHLAPVNFELLYREALRAAQQAPTGDAPN